MNFKEIQDGRFSATVVDWDVAEVEQLDNKPQMLIKFAFQDEDEKFHEIWWKGFFQKKDGEISKKTLDTLMTCGFKYKKLSDVGKEDALDTEKELEITLERNEEGYLEVQWVNEPGGAGFANALGKEEGAKKLAGLDGIFSGEIAKARQDAGLADKQNADKGKKSKKKSGKKVENHAPGADSNFDFGPEPNFDSEEEIPF